MNFCPTFQTKNGDLDISGYKRQRSLVRILVWAQSWRRIKFSGDSDTSSDYEISPSTVEQRIMEKGWCQSFLFVGCARHFTFKGCCGGDLDFYLALTSDRQPLGKLVFYSYKARLIPMHQLHKDGRVEILSRTFDRAENHIKEPSIGVQATADASSDCAYPRTYWMKC